MRARNDAFAPTSAFRLGDPERVARPVASNDARARVASALEVDAGTSVARLSEPPALTAAPVRRPAKAPALAVTPAEALPPMLTPALAPTLTPMPTPAFTPMPTPAPPEANATGGPSLTDAPTVSDAPVGNRMLSWPFCAPRLRPALGSPARLAVLLPA